MRDVHLGNIQATHSRTKIASMLLMVRQGVVSTTSENPSSLFLLTDKIEERPSDDQSGHRDKEHNAPIFKHNLTRNKQTSTRRE